MKIISTELAKLLEITHFTNISSASNSLSPSQSAPADSSTNSARSTEPSSSNTSHKTPVGALAGGIAGVAILALLGVLLFLVRKRRRPHEPKHNLCVELSGESKHRQGQGPQEMYQMPPEMEGSPRQSRLTELRGDGPQSPAELRAEYEVPELNGSVP